MLELYYFHEATCGIKARLALLEKGVAFTPRILERFELTSDDYLAINPDGVVPTLVHGGSIIRESSVICLYVDDAFDGPPLRPDSAIDRARMYTWLKAIDEKYFRGIGSLTYALVVRSQILERYPTADAIEAYLDGIRIAEYRERRRRIIRDGLDAAPVADGIDRLRAMVDELETALAQNEFVAGDRYSLADACLAPLVMRLDLLGLQRLWDHRPRAASWWRRMQERDAYRRIVQESFPEHSVAAFRDAADRQRAALSRLLDSRLG